MAAGLQESFSWKGVALGAVGAAGGAGIGAAASGNGVLAGSLGGPGLTATVGRAVLGNVITQGVGVVTGLQKKFDWRGVAASAVSSGVGWGVGELIGNAQHEGWSGMKDATRASLASTHWGNTLIRAAGSGIVAGAASSLVRNRRVDWNGVLQDAVGSAVGNLIAEQMKVGNPASAYDYRNGSDMDSDNASAARERYSFGNLLVEQIKASSVPADAGGATSRSSPRGAVTSPSDGTPRDVEQLGRSMRRGEDWEPLITDEDRPRQVAENRAGVPATMTDTDPMPSANQVLDRFRRGVSDLIGFSAVGDLGSYTPEQRVRIEELRAGALQDIRFSLSAASAFPEIAEELAQRARDGLASDGIQQRQMAGAADAATALLLTTDRATLTQQESVAVGLSLRAATARQASSAAVLSDLGAMADPEKVVALLDKASSMKLDGRNINVWQEVRSGDFAQILLATMGGPASRALSGMARVSGAALSRLRAGMGERPSWRQSEVDVGTDLAGRGYRAQISFKNGVEVPYGTKGSSRPEYFRPGSSVEVKNYNVETPKGQDSLVRNVSDQAITRATNLPNGTEQRVVIDVRGQSVTRVELNDIVQRIVDRSGGVIKPENIQFKR